jgi:hypothetical protein
MSSSRAQSEKMKIIEQVQTVTVTNAETQTVTQGFNLSNGQAKSDGVITVILYPDIQSGTPSWTVNIIPLDKSLNQPENASDVQLTLMTAEAVSDLVKGTDGGYMYALTDLPKCFGIDIEIVQTGTAVVNASVSTLF